MKVKKLCTLLLALLMVFSMLTVASATLQKALPS